MTFILVNDEKRCNFCVYWTGKRKEDEDFVYVDFDSAEGGICLYQESVTCCITNGYFPTKDACDEGGYEANTTTNSYNNHPLFILSGVKRKGKPRKVLVRGAL